MADWLDFAADAFDAPDLVIRAAHLRQFIENIAFVRALPFSETFTVHNANNSDVTIAGTTMVVVPDDKYEIIVDTFGGDVLVVSNVYVDNSSGSNANGRFAIAINGARHHGLSTSQWEITERIPSGEKQQLTLMFLLQDLEPGQYTLTLYASASAGTLRLLNTGANGMWAMELTY